MGLRTKQLPVDHQGLEYWSQTLLPRHTAEELPKAPAIRRQQQQPEPLSCPRCGSTNTKFCYYNNYNKSQPRHFCKSCKRHWTKGGSLRNVPVGGGRKNKHPRILNALPPTTTTTASTMSTAQDCLSSAPTGTSMSNILHKTLTCSSSSPLDGINISRSERALLESNDITDTTGLNVSTPQNPNAEYPIFSRLSTTFDKDTSLINPTSYESLNDQYDHYSMNLDSTEESTVTTLDIPTTSGVPWPGPEINSFMDLPNYWNWDEIDVLTSSADLNIAWDDVIKP